MFRFFNSNVGFEYFTTLVAVFCAFLGVNLAEAASVSKANSKQVVLQLDDGESIEVGQNLFLVEPGANKRLAQIKITQVKGSRAMGQILKGKARPGLVTMMGGGKKSAEASSAAEEVDYSRGREKYKKYRGGWLGLRWAGMLGLNSGTMVVKEAVQGATITTNMSGMGFSLKAAADKSFGQSIFGFRGLAGIDTLSMSGTRLTEKAKTDIMYLGFDGYLTLDLFQGSGRWWAGFGGVFLVPMSKTSNILLVSEIGTNSTINLALGWDIEAGRRYFPVQIDYAMFPDSSVDGNKITSNWIHLRAGISF